jgi:hypothetical protein
MAITDTTRVCSCHALISDASAVQCLACGLALCPHHSQWPSRLKWFLLAELARSLFHSWHTPQQVWENLLRDSLNGIRAGTGPNPAGTHITMSTPAAELYPIALERSDVWRASGSPLGPTITALRRSA